MVLQKNIPSCIGIGFGNKAQKFITIAQKRIGSINRHWLIGASYHNKTIEFCGNIVLTVAVLSILITAPFGAICVDNLYKRLLEKQ